MVYLSPVTVLLSFLICLQSDTASLFCSYHVVEFVSPDFVPLICRKNPLEITLHTSACSMPCEKPAAVNITCASRQPWQFMPEIQSPSAQGKYPEPHEPCAAPRLACTRFQGLKMNELDISLLVCCWAWFSNPAPETIRNGLLHLHCFSHRSECGVSKPGDAP